MLRSRHETATMLRLFYFSGTGNARNVATWIASAWREHGRAAEVCDLAKLAGREVRIEPGDEIGLASPTHGFNLPPITLKFLFAFPRAPGVNRAFIVNTRAGLRLFGLHVPGLSGVAQILPALVLCFKGYRVVGMRPIDLPSNWISLHPGLRAESVRFLYERCQLICRRFAERLLDGRCDRRALWDLPLDLLIAPISLGYYLVGRFFFAKSFVASSACDGCAACVEQCPVQALRIVDGRPFWTYRCESCMRCMNQCPRRAIETAHGFVIAVPVLLSLVTSLVYPALHSIMRTAWVGNGFLARALRSILESVVMLGVLFLSYRGLHRALRSPLVERVVLATSLTHFGFWRRYRAPKGAGTTSRTP